MTEEKIKLYEELHPQGKEFPKTKKPDEKVEDMQWLDEKIAKFQELKAKKDENPDQDTNANPAPQVPEVKISEQVKVYTVDQIKYLPEDEFTAIAKEVEAGLAKVLNQ